MRILAIDSSGLVATVAVVEEENEISKTISSNIGNKVCECVFL